MSTAARPVVIVQCVPGVAGTFVVTRIIVALVRTAAVIIFAFVDVWNATNRMKESVFEVWLLSSGSNDKAETRESAASSKQYERYNSF